MSSTVAATLVVICSDSSYGWYGRSVGSRMISTCSSGHSFHIIGFAFFIALAFFDIIGAIALWTFIKVKDEEPQVQLATIIILNKNAIIEVMAF